MNVQGPVPHLPRVLPAAAPSPARPAAPAPASDESASASASAAPAPQEATFWDLLTPEERDFFAQQTTLGPLSYGPGSARKAAQPGPLGQRVDVRG